MSENAGVDFGKGGDPRMRGFKTRASVDEVSAWIVEHIRPLASEEIALGEAWGRVLARDIIAPFAVPPFDRAAMDGYAVRAEETFGASDYMPAAFRCVGRSRPGLRCPVTVGPAETVEVATGAPLPKGADAVVPVESARVDGLRVQVCEALPQGRNVGRCGEDIAAGTVVLKAGRVVRPQDLGVLSAVGAAQVAVVRRPRVAALITGDELLAPGTPARDYQIPDVNSVMIAALVARDGGSCAVAGLLPDSRTAIRDAILDVAGRTDLILVSGGSSAGPEDHVPGIVAELGRLIAHGLALRPASPTGLGLLRVDDRPVVMLPGNPVSCLCGYDFVAGPLIRRLGGRDQRWPYRSVTLPLARKLASAVGRVDYARVWIRHGQVEPLSSSGASILSSVSRADGFVVIPADLEGYPAGASVEVWCYDEFSLGEFGALQVPDDRLPPNFDQSIRNAHQTPLG
ncbi:MAG TPA: gephyrin-like molybdotransferase Glp [Isosphaeraceae bacterium]|nr:gephyrin-like molybdotransferase Glp [Isosphaeraceae bacterium]